MYGIDLPCYLLFEEFAHHRSLARVTGKKDMYLTHIAPLERRRHRLKEVFNAAANAILKCALKLLYVDVQAYLRTISSIPRLFR